MAGRPTAAPAPVGSLRVEILKELQQLIENREARDRLEKSALAEAKGREHWVLHLLLRAQESTQARTDTLIGTAYTNLVGRFADLEARIGHLEQGSLAGDAEIKAKLESLEAALTLRVERALTEGLSKLLEGVSQQLAQNIGDKWRPVEDAIDGFSQSSKQIAKDVSDTYRVSTQTRLLSNENARRIADLGRDLVALEESLKLVVAKTLEESFAAFESRVAALEAANGATVTGGTNPAPG